jgi:hypothetical protein
MKSYSKRAILKYRIAWVIIIVAIALIVLAAASFRCYPLLLIPLLFEQLGFYRCIVLIADKTLLSVIYENLDPVEYQKIANDKRLKVPASFKNYAAMATGDYQVVINISSDALSRKKYRIKVKYYHLCYLAQAYFELRDFEKLQILLAKYEEYKALYPSKSFFKTPNSIWDYTDIF